MAYLTPPKRLSTRPASVSRIWNNAAALCDLVVSPDLTEDELRAIARHASYNIVACVIQLRPTLPVDVVIWLSVHRARLRSSLVSRPELPMERLIEMVEVEKNEWYRNVMVTRLRHRAATEGLTHDQLIAILTSKSDTLRQEGVLLTKHAR